ncbi:MAG: hypothetical protein ACLUE8_05635 [Lachnospiraceae bacterium]
MWKAPPCGQLKKLIRIQHRYGEADADLPGSQPSTTVRPQSAQAGRPWLLKTCSTEKDLSFRTRNLAPHAYLLEGVFEQALTGLSGGPLFHSGQNSMLARSGAASPAQREILDACAAPESKSAYLCDHAADGPGLPRGSCMKSGRSCWTAFAAVWGWTTCVRR